MYAAIAADWPTAARPIDVVTVAWETRRASRRTARHRTRGERPPRRVDAALGHEPRAPAPTSSPATTCRLRPRPPPTALARRRGEPRPGAVAGARRTAHSRAPTAMRHSRPRRPSTAGRSATRRHTAARTPRLGPAVADRATGRWQDDGPTASTAGAAAARRRRRPVPTSRWPRRSRACSPSAAVLWAGAALACVATGRAVPRPAGVLAALAALGHPPTTRRRPGRSPEAMPGPIAYWAATVARPRRPVAGARLGLTWRWWPGSLACDARRDRPDVRTLPGLAEPARSAVRGRPRGRCCRRAAVVRPSLADAARRRTRTQVGYRLGRVPRRELWCSVEDSALLVGPPRMGKGLHVVIPWVLDAPGPVVTTSTRPDTLAVTHQARAARGPVAIFDPQRLAGLPGGLRWSPVRGCETPRTALVRARGLAAGAGFGRGACPTATSGPGRPRPPCAACCTPPPSDGRRALDVYRWSLNPALAEDAVTVLDPRTRDAADGWADALDAADPRRPPHPRLDLARRPPGPRRPRRPRRPGRRRPRPGRRVRPRRVPRRLRHPLPARLRRVVRHLRAAGRGVRRGHHRDRPRPAPPAHPARGWTRRCCSPWTRSPTSPRCRPCPR